MRHETSSRPGPFVIFKNLAQPLLEHAIFEARSYLY